MMDEELGGFGDARLARVGALLLSAMKSRPTMCLHSLARDRGETVRFGAFLNNSAVSSEEMLVYAARQTKLRATGRHVLAIQDTTELHFATHRASKRGFGVGGNGIDIGLFIHPTVVVDAHHGGVIGLSGAVVLNRLDGPRPIVARAQPRTRNPAGGSSRPTMRPTCWTARQV